MLDTRAPSTARAAVIGGVPTVSLDVPIISVFLFFYVLGAASNMTIFQLNKRRGHKFLISLVLFGFCMSRIVTCILRIVWATRPTNSNIAIAAQIFVNAGILLVYLINLIFAQRILRAKQPTIGWHKALSLMLKTLYGLLIGALIMAVTSLALSTTTKDPNVLKAIRDVQLTAITVLLVVTVLPLFLLGLAYIPPKSSDEESFGIGRTDKKALVTLITTLIAITISGFKAGTAWEHPRLASNPAWYHSKACFYVFNFSLEIIVLLTFLSAQVDKLFHVPNGSKGPGDYSKGSTVATEDGEMKTSTSRINSNEDQVEAKAG